MSHAEWLQAVLNREAAIKANDAEGFRVWREVANDLAAVKAEGPSTSKVLGPSSNNPERSAQCPL